MRNRLVAGNWKMNKTPAQTDVFINRFLELVDSNHAAEILLLPPFTSLDWAGKLLAGVGISLGGQDLYFEPSGPFTGEISAEILLACHCSYVLVGHSERRTILNEDETLVNRKVLAATTSGIRPIFCVGETLREHQQGKARERICFQLEHGLAGMDQQDATSVVIAYEPLWAIGTGETASPQAAQETINMIRKWLAVVYDDSLSQGTRILYGGSVNPENTAALLDQPDIDGVLVGGASLSPETFAQIANCAGQSAT